MQIIEKTIDTSKRHGPGSDYKYPFDQLTKGTCLVIKANKKDAIKKQAHRVRAAIYAYKKYHELNWHTKVLVENGLISLYRIL